MKILKTFQKILPSMMIMYLYSRHVCCNVTLCLHTWWHFLYRARDQGALSIRVTLLVCFKADKVKV
jgi:hypothetical protein